MIGIFPNTLSWLNSPRPLGWDAFQPTVFTGTRNTLSVYWLDGCRWRLPDAAVGEAQHSHLVAKTGIFEIQKAVPPGSNASSGESRFIAGI